MRQAIYISAKLYQCRKQQIYLSCEDVFLKTFVKWKPIVLAGMNKHNCTEIEALIKLLEVAAEKPDGGMMMHVLNAVVCEMCEPTITCHLDGLPADISNQPTSESQK